MPEEPEIIGPQADAGSCSRRSKGFALRMRVLGGFEVLDDEDQPVPLTTWQFRFLAALTLQEPSSGRWDGRDGRSSVVSETTLELFGATWKPYEGTRLRAALPGRLPDRVNKRDGYWLEGPVDVDLWTFRTRMWEGYLAFGEGRAADAAACYLAAEHCWPDDPAGPPPFGHLPETDLLSRKARELLCQRQEMRLWWWRARCEARDIPAPEELAPWVHDTGCSDLELRRKLVRALLVAAGVAHGRNAMAARAEELKRSSDEVDLSDMVLRQLWTEVETHREVANRSRRATTPVPEPPDPPPPSNRAKPRKHSGRPRVARYGMVAVLLVSLGTWAIVRSQSEEPQRFEGAPDSPAGVEAGAPQVPIAFHREADGAAGLYTINADGTDERRLTSSQDSFPVWSPDGGRIAFKRAAEGRDQLYVVAADGTSLTRLTDTLARESFPSWSPDGQRLAFKSNRGGNDEIWIVQADGSRPVQLTKTNAKDSYPAWSPDGRRIAFTSERDGNAEIYVINVDGTGERRLTNDPANDHFPHWSPDGTLVTFTSFRDGNNEIYVIVADGSGPRRLTNHPGSDFGAVWSKDGRQIAFESNRDGSTQIFVMGADGSNAKRVTSSLAPSTFPAWGVA